MTTDKPNVQRYTDMGSETICPINNLRKSDDGNYVLYEDYESLQALYEKLLKHLQSLIDQTTPLVPEPGNPMWSRRIQLDEVIEERDQLRAECEELRKNADRYRPLPETVQGEPIPAGFALIKLDPRTGKPLVTSEMKAKHIGEYWWDEGAPYYDEQGVLHGYVARRVVPWDLCKEIYKSMASTAMLSAQPAEQQPVSWIRIRGDHVILSRCDWMYPASTEDSAGPRDERRFAAVGRRDGDIVLPAPEGAVDREDLKTMLAWPSASKSVEQQPDVTQLVEALEQIERWDGFPSTGETWEGSGKPVSYGAAFGSYGERDFMREVARTALATYLNQGGES